MSAGQDRESARDVFKRGPRDFSRFKPLTGHDIANLTPPEMLVEDLIPAASVIGVTADAGSGKSWMAMDLMRALIEGGTFMGRRVIKSGPVLFIGFDSSEHDYGRQWRRITHRWEPTPAACDDDEERQRDERDRFASEMATASELRDRADWLIHPDDLMLDNPEHVADLIDYILSLNQKHSAEQDSDMEQNPVTGEWDEVERPLGVVLVVIDTYGAGVGGEFLHPTVQRTVLKDLRAVAEETGASVLVLHHSAGPNEYRPVANWAGGVFGRMGLDVWFHLKKESGDNSRKVIEVQVEKFRGISPNNFRFVLDVADPLRADLRVETVAEAATRKAVEANQRAEAERKMIEGKARVIEELRLKGRFKRSTADPIFKRNMPGWGKKGQENLKDSVAEELCSWSEIGHEGEGRTRVYWVRDQNGANGVPEAHP
jgi:hypothetical protein